MTNINGVDYDLTQPNDRATARTNNPGWIVDDKGAINPGTGQTAGNTSGGAGGGQGQGQAYYSDPNRDAMILNNAKDVANQTYLNARLRLETEENAFAEAQQAFTNEITKAGLTGMYQGAPTMATQQYYANTFGNWGTPTAGQQTLQAQKQQADLYGQYYGPGQGPTAGQTTLYAQQQAYNQWLDAQKQSLSQWNAQQTAAQNYLTMMAGLRGPADWAQYQKVLGATPGGMKDLAAAAAGQYIPGGGATTGVAPTPVSMQNFLGSATGTSGGYNPQDQAAMQSLVAPNQMAPQTWNALQPSQQQMLLGAWESQGYNKDDAKNLFSQSLPKYGGMAPTSGSFRLQ